MEELLNAAPLDQYSNLLRTLDQSLRNATATSSELSTHLSGDHVHAPEHDSTDHSDIIPLFEKLCIVRGTKDDHLDLKQAEAKWPHFVEAVEALHLGLTPLVDDQTRKSCGSSFSPGCSHLAHFIPPTSSHAVRDKVFICMDIAHIGDDYLACESCSVQSSL